MPVLPYFFRPSFSLHHARPPYQAELDILVSISHYAHLLRLKKEEATSGWGAAILCSVADCRPRLVK